MKVAQPVQRPRFDAEKFTPRGESKMQNCIGLERFVERFEFLRDPGITNRQRGEFEIDAEARQSRSMSAKRMDEHHRCIGADARKFPETCDENAQ